MREKFVRLRDIINVMDLLALWPGITFGEVRDLAVSSQLQPYRFSKRVVDPDGQEFSVCGSNIDLQDFRARSIRNVKCMVFNMEDVERLQAEHPEFKWRKIAETGLERLGVQQTGSGGGDSRVLKNPAEQLPDADKVTAGESAGQGATIPKDPAEGAAGGNCGAPPTPESLVEDLRAQGIMDKKKLAAEVDKVFPGQLSHVELGRLLPARPGAIVSREAAKSQGQRLRGKK